MYINICIFIQGCGRSSRGDDVHSGPSAKNAALHKFRSKPIKETILALCQQPTCVRMIVFSCLQQIVVIE